MAKYIVVTGGVISGIGKGVAAASIGLLLSMRGLKVTPIKFDPYFNANAGVLSPSQHGEVFLCSDGTETDLDLGTYERMIDIEVSANNILTSGTLYKELFTDDENGKYLGQTIQIIPHLTDKIQEKLYSLGKTSDVVIIEIGGTVGDLESGPYLEAIRQFKQKNKDDVLIMLVAPILWISIIKEFKTKPLQSSVKDLQAFGIQPDILLCRTEREVNPKLFDKISNLTNVPKECIFEAPNVRSIYEIPIEFYNRNLDSLLIDKFHLNRNICKIHKHKELIENYFNSNLNTINIGIIGKYENSEEAYVSLKEALFHSSVINNVKINIEWIKAEDLENENYEDKLKKLHGIIVPGGFDSRGVQGKINAVKYAREYKIPFLGLCLGLQCAVIEMTRNVLGITDADSEEFNPESKNKVIHYVAGQKNLIKKSATMRLGSYDCELTDNSLVINCYNSKKIVERHRHRYEVNPEYIKPLNEIGFKVSGIEPNTGLIEFMELDVNLHPFFIGTQSHPEYKSRLHSSHPLFKKFVECIKNINNLI